MIFIKCIMLLITISTVIHIGYTQDTTETAIKHGCRFIDLDGDGYNDNAPDHDGDGIPNGLDPDWQRRQGGRGKGRRFYHVNISQEPPGTGKASGDTTVNALLPDSLIMPAPAQGRPRLQGR
jgi:hypothetical protein